MARKTGPKLLFMLLMAIAIGLGGYMLRRQRAGTSTSDGSARSAAKTGSAAQPAGSGSAVISHGQRPGIRRIDPTTRKHLLEQIATARAKHDSGTVPAPPAGSAPALPVPELSKDYIRTQVRELIPLLSECYDKAILDDPNLAGKLVVKFSISGEPEIAGLVENSEVDAQQSTISNASMVECVRETMYAAEFVAPSEGGRVDITYPFEFTSTP